MTGLFGEIETVKQTRRAVRAEKARRCYQITASAWKESTYEFATKVFLPGRDTFIFEDLTAAYDTWARRHQRPGTLERRAFAGLANRLLKDLCIERVAGRFAARSQGNASQVYRSLVKGD